MKGNGLPRYWTGEIANRVLAARSYEALGDQMLLVIANMVQEHPGEEIGVVCGPITSGGFRDRVLNLAVFQAAIEVARENGLVVIDQVPFEKHMDRLIRTVCETTLCQNRAANQYCRCLLEKFYRPVFASGLIRVSLFLPLWPSSEGASWEREELPRHRVRLGEYPLDLYQLALQRAGVPAPPS